MYYPSYFLQVATDDLMLGLYNDIKHKSKREVTKYVIAEKKRIR